MEENVALGLRGSQLKGSGIDAGASKLSLPLKSCCVCVYSSVLCVTDANLYRHDVVE